MIDITIATATVTGRIVYPDGNGPGEATFIPFTITVGDNCCEGHAESKAHAIMNAYVKSANELESRYSSPELAHVEYDE